MSAKGVLLMTLVMRHVAEDTARELIDAALREHAHELAEQQRKWVGDPDGAGSRADRFWRLGGHGVADMIDPESVGWQGFNE